MALIVKKFGGSSLGSIDLIDNLAKKISTDKKQGDDIVVVVSAMAKTTDHLFFLAKQISDKPYQRELDMLVTAGERISMSLLSIALHKYGVSAISFTGSQSGIITNNCHGNAKIIDVKAVRIKEELKQGKIVIVAGYQGVSSEKEITTLGRGGSDTTAVALAGYLNAEACEMYKDVDGIYSADPKIVPKATKYNEIDYRTMIFIASSGSQVIHPRAIEFAMRYNIPLILRSAFNNKIKGTIITAKNMKETRITNITGKDNLSMINIVGSEIMRAFNMLSDSKIGFYEFEELSVSHLRIITSTVDLNTLTPKLQQLKGVSTLDGVNSISCACPNPKDNLQLIYEVIKYIKSKKIDIIWMTNGPLGFHLYFQSDNLDDLTRELHRIFIEQ